MLGYFFLASMVTCTYARFTTQPTGTPIPPGNCRGMNDACKTFDGYQRFARARTPHYYIDCDIPYPKCRRCPSTLHFSDKCQRCEYYEDDRLNDCPLTTSSTTTRARPTTPSPPPNFCRDKNIWESYDFEGYPGFYIVCVFRNAQVMLCPAGLVYDKSCDACVYTWEVGMHARK